MQEIAIYTQPLPLQVKEYRGQRILTFKDIDTLHQRPEGTARRNFNENRNRFIEGEDYFILTPSLKDEFRTLEIPNRGLTAVTKIGYLMLVKSFIRLMAKRTEATMTADKEYQESFAIAREIARKIHRIADKTGIPHDVLINASVGTLAKVLPEKPQPK